MSLCCDYCYLCNARNCCLCTMFQINEKKRSISVWRLKKSVSRREKGRETCGTVTMKNFSNYENVCTEAWFPSFSTTGPSHLLLALSTPHSLSLSSHLQTLLLRRGVCLVNMKLLRCQYLNSLQFTVRDSSGEKERESEIVKEKIKRVCK